MDTSVKKPLWKRKPFRILRILEPQEIQLFCHYLESPLFNPNPNGRLLEFFSKCQQYNVWKSTLDRETFLEISQQKLSNNAFDKLISKLNDQLISFTGYLGFMAESDQSYSFGLKFLAGKPLDNEEIDKKLNESKRGLRKKVRNAEYFKLSLDMNLVLALGSQSRVAKPKERGLHLLHEDLDAYYLIQKLRFLCASINEQHIYHHYWEQQGEVHLLNWFGSVYEQMPPLAKMYFHVYNILLGEGNQYHFQTFRKLLWAWEREEDQEVADLYTYLLNYYSIQINYGDVDILEQYNELLDEVIANGLLLENGKIRPEHFKNVISVKCRLGLLTEAKQFFKDFSNRLTSSQGGAASQFTSATILFHEGEYLQTIKLVEGLLQNPGATKIDHFYGLSMRCLLLKTYFESLKILDLEQWDEIEEKLKGLLRAFQGYIERKGVSKMSQIRHENFRKAVLRLYQFYYLHPIGNRYEVRKKEEELLLEFKSSSNLPDKAWFISQVKIKDHQ